DLPSRSGVQQSGKTEAPKNLLWNLVSRKESWGLSLRGWLFVLACAICTGTARAWAAAVSGREPSSGYEDPRRRRMDQRLHNGGGREGIQNWFLRKSFYHRGPVPGFHTTSMTSKPRQVSEQTC